VVAILTSAFPELITSVEDRKRLLGRLNDALVEVGAPIPKERMPTVGGIDASLRRLKTSLSKENVWLLAATGRAYRRSTDAKEYSSGYASFDDYVGATVDQLVKATTEILKWLDNPEHSAGIVKTLTPIAPMSQLVGIDLPKIFEATFPDETFGSGNTGPGVRFVLAVLREAGIRSDNGKPAAVIEMIVQARKRGKKKTGV
jgi:hypothetical protein